MLDQYQMVCYLSVGVIVGVVTSLVSRPDDPEKLDRFFELIHTPVRKGEHVATPCSLPEDPLPVEPRMFPGTSIELPKPSATDIGGFVAAWGGVAFIIWLTWTLSRSL